MSKNSLAIAAALPEKTKASATTALTFQTSHCHYNQYSTPTDLEQWARQDWQSSGADELFDANVQVMDGDRALNKILYSEKLPRINTGRLAGGILTKYSHLSQGGWLMFVLDPSADFRTDYWSCFKPIQPRTKHEGGVEFKTIKYEHPPKETVQPYFLKVTYRVWKRIANRYGIEMPALLPQTSYGKEFWEWAIANNLPTVITEGAKKTAALLCAGYVAIGLPGVWNFSEKVEGKQAWETPLNKWLQAFLKRYDQPQVTIAFDADSRPQTVENVKKAAIRLAKKLQWNVKADVKIAQWHPELGKGIDDVLVANGLSTVEIILDGSALYHTFCFLDDCKFNYPVDHSINHQHLGQIPEFSQKIIGIKSPKNTGKTYTLSKICDEYTQTGQKVIVITHRIQLGSELANRFGIEFINEIQTKDEWLMASLQGFALCIDSLHPHSKAKIDLTDNCDFDNAVVIVDESEQVLNHLVNSSTLKSNRAEILVQLEMLCQRADKIYLSDADLSDYSLDFFRNLADLGKSDVALIHNQYQFTDSAWDTSIYSEKTPDRMLLEIESQLQQGKRIFLQVGGQKSKSLYGAGNCLKRLAPYCSGGTLLLDSHTVADPEDAAYGITSKLNELTGYQLVVASPVIETGVSIEADLFDAVFGISYGVQSVQSVAQALARYRHPVPRHIWVQPRPANFQKYGGIVSKKQLKYHIFSNQKRLKKVIKDYGEGFDNGLFGAYLRSVIRFNLGHQAYQQNLEALLTADGHRITKVTPINITDEIIRQIRDAAYQAEIKDIVSADTPSDPELETLNNSTALTKAQRHKQRKGNLIKTYGECSEGMVKADDDGCFKPLKLLYYLAIGQAFLEEYDQRQLDRFTAGGQRLDHEIGRSVLGVKVAVLANLGLAGLLTGEKFNNDHPIAQIIANVDPGDFLATFGRKLPDRLGDRINAFLDLIGFKKEYVCRVGTSQDAVRHYRAVPKFEGIDYQRIFDYWLERDRDIAADSNSPAPTA